MNVVFFINKRPYSYKHPSLIYIIWGNIVNDHLYFIAAVLYKRIDFVSFLNCTSIVWTDSNYTHCYFIRNLKEIARRKQQRD